MKVSSRIKSSLGIYDRETEKIGHKLRKWFGYYDSIRVVGYNGYGTPERVHLKGRVLLDDRVHSDRDDDEIEHAWNMFRRYQTDEVPGATVRVHFRDQQIDVETGWEGYFDAEFAPEGPLDAEELWHSVEFELLDPKPEIDQDTFCFEGGFQVPQRANFGVISDIDDTIVHTGATDLMKHARIVLFNGPESRIPFSGVAAFYRALQNDDGQPRNPIWYVSSSPWNLYELFVEFMDHHGIPTGPLFLKDFGFDEKKFIKAGHEDYKKERIQRVLDAYPDLPFILIGDSGQKDPEVYQAIVDANPDRIAAVYLRDVTPKRRDDQVREIAEQVAACGVDMLLVEDTLEAARHAADNGWIEREELQRIRQNTYDEAERPGGLEVGLKKVGRKLREMVKLGD